MKTPRLTDIAFYSSLGKLFYSISAIDRHVSEEEIIFLKKNITGEWQSHSFVDTQLLQQILAEFDRLLLEKAEANSCFSEFKDFIETSNILIPQLMKSLIWKTADGISSSYAQKNKSEVIILAKLKSLLLNLPTK